MRDKKEKILILSASFGEGHKQVAIAIIEEIEKSFTEVVPVSMDIMKTTHPYLSPLSQYLYKGIIRDFPWLYSFLYQKTYLESTFSKKLNTIFLSRMNSILSVIDQIQPKVIISTYPFAAGIVSKLKQAGLINLPTVTVLTDYALHSYWIHATTDFYLVGSQNLQDRLLALNVAPEKILFTGIPVRQQFKQISKEGLIEKYQLHPETLTLLIMGGGDGFFGKGMSMFQAIESTSHPLQIMIVCGKNHKLKTRLEREFKYSRHLIKIYGFFYDVHELMALSDLMISKPGGITTSEALTVGLPLLIQHVLPGQEEENVNFLIGSGYALCADTELELKEILQRIIENTDILKTLRHNIHSIRSGISLKQALETVRRAQKQK